MLRVIRCAFALRRKTLANNLRAAFALDKAGALACVRAAGLPPDIRGERVDLAAFGLLADALTKMQVS